jgi:ribulose-phosphate 3-epimerase
MQPPALLSASIICADLLELKKNLGLLQGHGLDYLHFDIMDGRFVPGFGLSIPLLARLAREQPVPVEAHLIVEEPERHVPAAAEAGAAMITFHYEADPRVGRLAESIHNRGLKAGVAVNPETPVSVLKPFLETLDLVLIMAYPPSGPSRQPLPATEEKLRELRRLATPLGDRSPLFGLDGGLSEAWIVRFRQQGANFFVLGTTGLFKPAVRLDEQLELLRAAARS